MLLTPRFGLRKPENNDAFGQDDFNFNSDVIEGLGACARVYNSLAQSIANATLTALALDSERFDTDTLHDPAVSNSRLTCKTAGKYWIGANLRFDTNATGYRVVILRLNGVTEIGYKRAAAIGGGVPQEMEVSTLYQFAVGDYVEVIVYQTSGGALNVTAVGNFSPEFFMARVG